MKTLTNYRGGRLLLVPIAVVALGGASFLSVALASRGQSHQSHVARHKLTPRWSLSVFSRPAKIHATSADAGQSALPQSAILADVSSAGGTRREFYVWHRGSQEDCLITIASGFRSEGCGSSELTEAQGSLEIGWAAGSNDQTVFGLVPDGVSRLELTGTNGATSSWPVVNNVVDAVGANLAEVRYNLPNGQSMMHPVPSQSALERRVHETEK